VKLSRSRTAVLLAAGCAAFLSTAACHTGGNDSSGSSGGGSSGGGSPGFGNQGVASGNRSAQAGQSGVGAAMSTLNVTMSPQLGAIVTDSQGYTLYRFDRDSATPPMSRCGGACAREWLPATARGQITVTGLDRAMVGTVRRPDGTEQLAIAGWPLYRYAQDEPGELGGENVGGVWFASSPTGKKVQPPPGMTVGGGPNNGSNGGAGG
jgi:predicted lipoprotein with Yx(FWY)xxD motif